MAKGSRIARRAPLASNPLSQRYAAEAEAGNVVADLIQSGDKTFMEQAADRGWIAAVDDLPALAQWPKQMWNGKLATVTATPLTVAWNTSLVQPGDEPKGWQDVLAPRWKGQMLVVDPRSAAALMAWLYLMRRTNGDDDLRGLAAQEPRLVQSSVPGSQQLAAGSGAVLVPNTHGLLQSLLEEQAPVADAVFSPSTGTENIAGISAKAPHPNGATLLMNWPLSTESQAIIAKNGYTPVLPNILGVPALPPGYESPKIAEAMQQEREPLALLGIQ